MRTSRLVGLGRFATVSVLLALATVLVLLNREATRTDDALNRLSLVSSLRAASLQEEMATARSDAVLWSGFGNVRQRLAEIQAAWEELEPGAADRVRTLYVNENPFPEGEFFRLVDPGDGSAYSRSHALFQQRIQQFLAVHEYRDILLLNGDAEVVYSANKEPEFATNLVSGPWRDTHLAQTARAARDLTAGQVALSDFEPYEPSGGAWALFIAGPVGTAEDRGGPGALVFQLGAARLGARIARLRDQRGSARTVVLGDGYHIVGQSPWIEASGNGMDALESGVRRRAREAGAGSGLLRTGDGTEVLAAWAPLSFEGIQWVVLSLADREEIRSEGASERRMLLIVALLLWATAAVLTLGRRKAAPLERHHI
jgi:methyl-accepting chemotaxis protein